MLSLSYLILHSLSYLILSLSYPTPFTLCKYDSDEAGEYEMGDWVGVHLDLDAGG
jgi:hypothetical protein